MGDLTEAQCCQQQLRASVPGWARGRKTSAMRPLPRAKIGGVMALPWGSPRLVGAPLGLPRGWTRAGLGDHGTAPSCSAGTVGAGHRVQGARPVPGPELRNGVSGGAPENTPYLWGQKMSLNVYSCDFRVGFSVLVSVVWQTLPHGSDRMAQKHKMRFSCSPFGDACKTLRFVSEVPKNNIGLPKHCWKCSSEPCQAAGGAQQQKCLCPRRRGAASASPAPTGTRLLLPWGLTMNIDGSHYLMANQGFIPWATGDVNVPVQGAAARG